MVLVRVPLAGLLLAAIGCMTVKKVQPADYIPQHKPDVVWVTTTDNAYTPVAQPQIVGDSLKGTWVGLQEPVAISLKEIQSVQARMPSPKRTVMLFSALGVVGGAVVYTLLTAGSSGSTNNGCPLDKNGQPQQFC